MTIHTSGFKRFLRGCRVGQDMAEHVEELVKKGCLNRNAVEKKFGCLRLRFRKSINGHAMIDIPQSQWKDSVDHKRQLRLGRAWLL